jgi:hypothetical protein
MFGGDTFSEKQDGDRLRAQSGRVWRLMIDGEWRALGDIAQATGDPPASISARLRDCRKARFGAHKVERRRLPRGLFLYRLVVNRLVGLRRVPSRPRSQRGAGGIDRRSVCAAMVS